MPDRYALPSAPVCVLMPVYNGEKYLRESISSILDQTFTDFTLLIIDDGSTDGSAEIIRSFGDPRIRLVRNETNLGLVATLNKGLEIAEGEFLVRMDCDDIAVPHRIERQIAYLRDYPEIGLCGSWYTRFSDSESYVEAPPAADADIRFALIFENAFGHNTILFRLPLLKKLQLRYDADFHHAEDYEFWVRCAQHMKVANIPESLVLYRFHPDNTSSVHRDQQIRTANAIRKLQLDALGLTPTDEELRIHYEISHQCFAGNIDRLRHTHRWLLRLAEQVHSVIGESRTETYARLAFFWYYACAASAKDGLRVMELFVSSPISRKVEAIRWLKLMIRCLLRRGLPAPASGV